MAHNIVSTMRALFGRYRYLLIELTRREFTDRYAGQTVGVAWAWLSPIVLMLLYIVVFKAIYGSRLSAEDHLPRDYATYVFSGLVPWLAVQEVLARAPDAVLSHASYVKQIAFPLEVLPVKRALSALPLLFATTLFMIAYELIVFHALPWTIVLWPIFLSMFLVFVIGIDFLLGALGIFFRDLREIMSLLLSANLFLLPILFPPGQAHPMLEKVFVANPFSYLIWVHQDIMFYGSIVHPAAWIIAPLISLSVFAAGYVIFERLRGSFGDAI